jgi:hypothetical protein
MNGYELINFYKSLLSLTSANEMIYLRFPTDKKKK